MFGCLAIGTIGTLSVTHERLSIRRG